MLVSRAMTTLLAILVSGVLFSQPGQPMPNYHFVFEDSNGKLTGVVTNKDGRFQVDLAPGTYRTEAGTVTVGNNKLKLTLPPKFPVLEPPPARGDFTVPPGQRG